jgi:hypothetical protein
MQKMRAHKSEDYNWIFNTDNGSFCRWGKTIHEDPKFSPIGPEILDLEISTICHGPRNIPCPWCSPPGTLVNTPNGMVKIEELNENDYVISHNEDDNIRLNEIKKTYSREYEGELIDIETEGGKFISLTPNHDVKLSNGRWVPAGKLKEGDDVVIF